MGNYTELNRKIAYAYNLCVIYTSQIVEYNDQYYMKQIFAEILNNIHIENFPKDDALCELIIDLLETISALDINKDKPKAIEAKYQRQKKQAFWSAIPSPSIFISGGSNVSSALSALLTVGTAVMNYKKNLNDLEEDKRDKELELEVAEKEAINALRINMFHSAFRIYKEHSSLPDEFRLSENDVKLYNEALACNDSEKQYDLLLMQKERFEAFPPFWYNLGEAAREVYQENKDENFKHYALKAYEKFEEIHFVFLRQDMFAASCAIEHISLLNPKSNKEKICELLGKAIRYSRDNLDLIQQCVPIALQIYDIDRARSLLKRLVLHNKSVDINGKLLSLIYNRYYYDEAEYLKLRKNVGEENVFPWIEIREQYRLESFENNIETAIFKIKRGEQYDK